MSLVSGPGKGGNALDSQEPEQRLYAAEHVAYIQTLDTRDDELEYHLTEHLRLNGIYWGLTALHLLGNPTALRRDDVLKRVIECFHDRGGFGAAKDHDPHMLYTVSAVQILAMLDAFEEFDSRCFVEGMAPPTTRIALYISNLQTSTGTFAGDEWGETDTRFLYGALNALSLLGRLDMVDLDKAVAHIDACANLDGGYGTTPGAESHAGQIFTCVSALAIAGKLDLVNRDRLGQWLCERQLKMGGLNGRPEKEQDVCYSWWVLSSLATIERLHWIDGEKLRAFILSCQDPVHGGISDRPKNMVDVFHTVFGICGLSLLQHAKVGNLTKSTDLTLLKEVDPLYCMPKEVTSRVLSQRGREVRMQKE